MGVNVAVGDGVFVGFTGAFVGVDVGSGDGTGVNSRVGVDVDNVSVSTTVDIIDVCSCWEVQEHMPNIKRVFVSR